MAQTDQITIRLSPQILGLVAASILGLGGAGGTIIQLSTPIARDDPYTGSEFKAFYNREFVDLREQVRLCQEWQIEHERWGRDLAGQNRAEINNMQGDIKTLQNQILHLYNSEYSKN